jgi:thioredoxin 1
MSEHVKVLDDQSFDVEVRNTSLPIIVDFWAEWCGPCKMLAPIFAETAVEYAGKVRFAKVDVDASPETPSKYGVRGIPTLILFKNGSAVATKVGALSKSQLIAFINQHI